MPEAPTQKARLPNGSSKDTRDREARAASFSAGVRHRPRQVCSSGSTSDIVRLSGDYRSRYDFPGVPQRSHVFIVYWYR